VRTFAFGMWLLAAASAAAQPGGLTRTRLFDGAALTGWTPVSASATVQDGFLRISAGNGWLRSNRAYSDFVLHVEARAAAPGTDAGITVRGYAPSNGERPAPEVGYEIVVQSGRTPGGFVRDASNGAAFPFPGDVLQRLVVSPSDSWHRYDVICRRDTIQVSIDGVPAARLSDVKNPSGFIGFEARGGILDIRLVEIEMDAIPGVSSSTPIETASATPGTTRAVPPRALSSVNPTYTREAMQQNIQGMVTMDLTVGVDGVARDIAVVKSLDTQFGLDRAAVDAVREWRFAAATRDGAAVPYRVTIEMEFRMRR